MYNSGNVTKKLFNTCREIIKMNVILLSGGSGKRLWPLSNDVRSKQFIKLFENKNGEKESMVQKMYHGLLDMDPRAKIVIATNRKQIAEIQNQIGDVNLSVEPCKRNTFPAILLAVSYMHDVMQVSDSEPVLVCPVDSYISNTYFDSISRLYDLAKEKDKNLCLMGVAPTCPSEKYGYIIPKERGMVSEVVAFKEKPSRELALDYISKGALWNAGVFSFKINYLLKKAHEMVDFTDYYELLSKYETLTNISFDYAVVEKEPVISVLKHMDKWDDLGTWDALTSVMNTNIIGNAKVEEQSSNTHVINELNIPIVCLGLKDIVVAASYEGILVTSKVKSNRVKDYVDDVDAPVMHAEKSWGNYSIVDVGDKSTTMKIFVNAGKRMSYHAHERRDEIWVIVSGRGTTIVDGMKQHVNPGDVVAIAAGSRHTIIAETDLEIVETQIGENIDVKDKKKYEIE